MTNKIDGLCDAYARGGLGRRELIRRLGALGIAAGAAEMLVSAASTRALAADFDWKSQKGTAIKLLLNKHPYADAMIADLETFKNLTGMDVSYDIFPEDVYFDKVTAALSSRSSEYDAFMTGAYQTWQYGPAGWLVDLNEYIHDPAKTNPHYAWDDVLPNLRASDAWSGRPGDALGGPGAKQWALPWGFETYSLTYNKAAMSKMGLQPPKNMPELVEMSAKISKDSNGALYGCGVRGSRSWATIHPGFLSGFTNYGGKDFTFADGKLTSALNSKQSKEFTELFVKLVQTGGPKNWSTYTWYQVGQDLGAGAAAMIYDADILGYFNNSGNDKLHGGLAYAPFAPNPSASGPTSNVWIWSLGMSNFSQKKDAAWMFMQWATGTDHLLFGARKKDMVDPVRASVWSDSQFTSRLQNDFENYPSTYKTTQPDAKIYFTPQPLFFNVTTQWAASLQQMVAGEGSVSEGLDKLADSINGQMRDAGLG